LSRFFLENPPRREKGGEIPSYSPGWPQPLLLRGERERFLIRKVDVVRSWRCGEKEDSRTAGKEISKFFPPKDSTGGGRKRLGKGFLGGKGGVGVPQAFIPYGYLLPGKD